MGKIKCLIIHGAAGHGRPFRLWIYWQTASSLPDLEEEEEEEEEMNAEGRDFERNVRRRAWRPLRPSAICGRRTPESVLPDSQTLPEYSSDPHVMEGHSQSR